MRKIMGIVGIPSKERGMNPFQLWIDTLPELKKYLDDYFKNSQKQVLRYPEIANYTHVLYNNGVAIEKLLAISMLATLKLYCD